MRLPRRAPAQTSNCIVCGLLITERKRKPCPSCGSMNRAVSVTATERPVVVHDHVN